MNSLVQSYDAEIEEVLAYHGGDVHAAIEALLKNRDFLVREVELSRLAVTHGQPVDFFRRAALVLREYKREDEDALAGRKK